MSCIVELVFYTDKNSELGCQWSVRLLIDCKKFLFFSLVQYRPNNCVVCCCKMITEVYIYFRWCIVAVIVVLESSFVESVGKYLTVLPEFLLAQFSQCRYA